LYLIFGGMPSTTCILTCLHGGHASCGHMQVITFTSGKQHAHTHTGS
jgi:hypothetical protein